MCALWESGGHRPRGVDELVRWQGGEVVDPGRAAEFGGDLGGDVHGEIGGEVGPGEALQDGAAEQPGCRGHDQHCCDAARPGGLAEDGDVARGTAEGGDVLAHPAQRGELIEQPAVIRCAFQVGEAFDPGSIVGTDHHHARTGQPRAVEVWVGRVAVQIGAAADPHDDRKSASADRRGPDGEGQPVIAHGRLARLGRGRPERGDLLDSLPRHRRLGGGESMRSDWWCGEGNAAKDRDPVLPVSLDCSGGSAHVGGHDPDPRMGPCPRPVKNPRRRPFKAPWTASDLPAGGQISPRVS